ncbi:tyrosine-type recombinase/integrase [Marinospirillum insulare]|uniref:Tyr recombinase domain-containing protein n=1 Tax=Marinospirillum insulare TaxID=217169 RepID=A0ABQ6A1Q3_9GAMM|nr:tyrosine-type recombinase/integrase [Marinospirillum insulare]GLR64507.1 hypothetical protein GCM10007878_19450 [Marinospirillum insulare]
MLSGYYPFNSITKALVTDSLSNLEKSITQSNIAIKHNAFTDYCLAMLFLATGHRPVNDPLEAEHLFDLEEGFILISDKVVHESRAWRLVALPKMACEQLEIYASYLETLLSHLHELPDSKNITDEICSLVAGKPKIPYFFYLDEGNPVQRQAVSPAKLVERWQDHWKLPINYLRHCMATELLHLTKRADLVSIQLGHITGTDHPFGVTAATSVKDSLSLIAEKMQEILLSFGWSKQKLNINKIGFDASSVLLKPQVSFAEVFGSKKRTLARKRKREAESKIIKKALKEVMQHVKGEPTQEKINSIVDLVVEQAVQQKVSVNSSLRFLYRFLRREKSLKLSYQKISQLRFLEEEASPFNSQSLIAYKLTRELRHKFIAYLSSKGKSKTQEKMDLRLAEIVVSSALFGGVADQDKLAVLAESLTKTTYHYNKQVFVDLALGKDKQATYRWFPDNLSLALLIGLYENNKKPIFHKLGFSRELANLTNSLGIDNNKDQTYKALALICRSALIFEAPGHLVRHLSGELPSVALPLAQWVRFQSIGKSLVQPREKGLPSPEFSASNTWLLNTYKPTVQKEKLKNAQSFLKDLRVVFNKSRFLNTSSNKSLSTRRKKQLVSNIKSWVGKNSEIKSSALKWAIVAWAVHLCEQGTRFKKNLAFSTIDNYVFLVARKLIALQPHANFLYLTEDDYEEIYLRVLETTNESIRFDLASRIIEFHKFLEEVYAVAEPNWSMLLQAANLTKVEGFADANMVSESEYLTLLNLLNDNVDLTTQLKTQYMVLLILGFRFGLRYGEAYRIKLTDIQVLDAETIILIVRNSIYGETKSNAGIRIVCLIEKMTHLEFQALSLLINSASELYEDEKQAFLMAEVYGTRELINRYETSYQLGSYLKHITGDNTLRFHHLRHSWATRVYGYIYPVETNQYLISPRFNPIAWQEFIGQNECSYPLNSLTTAIGHQSLTSTLESYIHSLAETHKNLVNLSNFRIKSSVYSYALQINQTVVRKRISRNNLLLVSSNIPRPKINLRKRPDKLPSSKNNKNTDEFSLVQIDQLLRRFSETKQNSSKIAYQLMVDKQALNRLLLQAAKVERESGFEFYRAQMANTASFINPEKITYPKVNFYFQENKRVANLLKDLSGRLKNFTREEHLALEKGLKVWKKNFVSRINETIISDNSELGAYLQMLELLNLGLKTTIINPEEPLKGTSAKIGLIAQAREKTQNRRLNRVAVKISLHNRVATYQTISRLLFVLNIYYDRLAST